MDATLATISVDSVSPDDEAMARVAAGESAALALLFERHKTRLYGFLVYLVADRALAEDLLSETFLRVYRARGRYRSGSGFVPWLLAIARNLALGELRRRAVWGRVQQYLLRQHLFRQSAEPEERWEPERDETREQVRAALARLPEEQRTALVLREYEGLEYREIGQVLGCSEEAARARAYRGRTAMRQTLRSWWEARETDG